MFSSCLRLNLNFYIEKQQQDWTFRLMLELCRPTQIYFLYTFVSYASLNCRNGLFVWKFFSICQNSSEIWMSEIKRFGFQTVPKSKCKPVQISACSDFGHSGFLGHTKCSNFSMFRFQTVSEIWTFRRVPSGSKWLATGFFLFWHSHI